MIEARFWEGAEGGKVRCRLCPHRCLIPEGKTGICGVRRNREGRLWSLVWGELAASHVDPIEKKPLFHFLPGTASFSVAAVGCNLRCLHCQNADISQLPRLEGTIVGRRVVPAEIVAAAREAGCRSVSYTYTEPTIWLEYAYDTCLLAKEAGLRNVFVTNGYIAAEALESVAPYLDAANIDLKGFSEDFYRRICGARLAPVLEAIALYRKLGVWLEITTLVIPGLNDSEAELRGIARFIRELGPEIPWHVTRFHPDYLMTDRDGTPLQTIRRAWEIGREEGLLYVYQGNVPSGDGERTLCPSCGREVIARRGFRLESNLVRQGACARCGAKVHGVWA